MQTIVAEELKNELGDVKKDFETRENELLADIDQIEATLKEQIEAQSKIIETAQKENDSLSDKNSELNASVDTLNSVRDSLEAEVERLKTELDELRDSSQKLQKSLKEQQETSQGDLASNQNENQAAITKLQEDIEKLNALLRQTEQDIAGLTTTKDQLESDPLQIHKDDDFDVTKLPVPDVIPEDSADSFVVDIGTYVPPKNTLQENKVRRRPTKPCRDDTRILIGIKTVPEGHNRREAIRKTWGNVTHYENFPAQVIFLLGMDSSSYKQNRAFEKLEKNDDLLVGDFVDSFHNLTYKDSLFLTWMKHECPSATYAFKGDDDTLVNPFELEKLVKEENDRQGRVQIITSALVLMTYSDSSKSDHEKTNGFPFRQLTGRAAS